MSASKGAARNPTFGTTIPRCTWAPASPTSLLWMSPRPGSAFYSRAPSPAGDPVRRLPSRRAANQRGPLYGARACRFERPPRGTREFLGRRGTSRQLPCSAKGATAWTLESCLVQPLAGTRVRKSRRSAKAWVKSCRGHTEMKVKNLQNSKVRALDFRGHIAVGEATPKNADPARP